MQHADFWIWVNGRITNTLALMFGASWDAITVPLGDLDRYVETAAGYGPIGVVALIATFVAIVIGVYRIAVAAYFRAMHVARVFKRIVLDHQMSGEFAEDRRRLLRELETLRNAPTVAATVSTPTLAIASPSSPTVCDTATVAPTVQETPQESRLPTVADSSPTVATVYRETPATVAATVGAGRQFLQLRDATPADVSAWAAERLSPRGGTEIKAGELLQDFAIWCDAHGMVVLNMTNFGAALGALGYLKLKKKYVMYQNVGLRSVPTLKVIK